MKPKTEAQELEPFRHLKRGAIYKTTLNRVESMTTAVSFQKCPTHHSSDRISFVGLGETVVFLELVKSAYGVFFKLIAGDQVGYMSARYGFRLKRVTSRMIRRMDGKETPSEGQEGACSDEPDIQEG